MARKKIIERKMKPFGKPKKPRRKKRKKLKRKRSGKSGKKRQKSSKKTTAKPKAKSEKAEGAEEENETPEEKIDAFNLEELPETKETEPSEIEQEMEREEGEEKEEIQEERFYIVPLAKVITKVQVGIDRIKRSAVLRAFVTRHMKPEGDVYISQELNERIWEKEFEIRHVKSEFGALSLWTALSVHT